MAVAVAGGFVGIVTAVTLGWRLFRDGVRQAMWEPLGNVLNRIDNLERVNAQRFADLDNALGKLSEQFRPNGGESHYDRLAHLTDRVADIAHKLERMSGA